jgi:hypothetical protein
MKVVETLLNVWIPFWCGLRFKERHESYTYSLVYTGAVDKKISGDLSDVEKTTKEIYTTKEHICTRDVYQALRRMQKE